MTLFRNDLDRPTPDDLLGAVLVILLALACAGIIVNVARLAFLKGLGQ